MSSPKRAVNMTPAAVMPRECPKRASAVDEVLARMDGLGSYVVTRVTTYTFTPEMRETPLPKFAKRIVRSDKGKR